MNASGSSPEARMVTLISPLAPESGDQVHPAPRGGDLRDKVIGIIDNSKAGSQAVLEEVAARLREKFGAREVIFRQKISMSAWAEEQLLDELAASCDVVLVGVGD